MSELKTFDFIVVGAGPAGCALASSLARSNSRPSVLLVEAGGDNSDPDLRIDNNKFVQYMNPAQALGYKSQPHASLAGREIDLARGKGLGGSSAVNFTIWTEGPRDDMDGIAEYAGDDAWSWSRCKARWEALQNFHCKRPDIPIGVEKYVGPEPGSYGTDGPLHIGYASEWDFDVTGMAEIWEANGFPVKADINSGDPLGVAVVPLTSWKGTRVTSADLLIRAPDNLTILTDAPVHRVLFEGPGNKAVGIATNDGRIFRSAKEVILSGGSLDSPKILLHSGIGPAEQLSRFGIAVIHDNASVGKDFKDHYHIPLGYQRAEHTSSKPAFYGSKAGQKAALREWQLFRTGPYANVGCGLALGFFKSEAVLQSAEFAALPAAERRRIARPTVPSYEVLFNVTAAEYYTSPETAPAISMIGVFVMNSQGSGEVRLQSADPAVPLAFHVGFLDHPYDRRVAIEGTRETMRVTRSAPFLKDNVAFLAEPKSDSDEDILQYWRDNATSTWHTSNTCRMGRDETAEGAVVDTDMRVYGVQGLRVADMSIVPVLVSAHTQACAYQVGLIAAEKLVAEHGL